jgi:uncharacterized protein (TIGR03085 family)
MSDHARSERQALADLLDEVGPDAPTLCGAWTTSDLVAHLVIRESDVVAAAGMVIGPLAGRTKATMDGLVHRLGYPQLVDRFRQGPPRWSLMRIAAIDEAANTMEFFVHHEDVRRAQPGWEPREVSDAMEEALWRRVTGPGRFLFRRCAVGLLVVRPNGSTVRVRGGEPTAVLAGRPSELALYMWGRKDVARVETSGPDAAVEALVQAPLGF